jgi:hypothetical protein
MLSSAFSRREYNTEYARSSVTIATTFQGEKNMAVPFRMPTHEQIDAMSMTSMKPDRISSPQAGRKIGGVFFPGFD